MNLSKSPTCICKEKGLLVYIRVSEKDPQIFNLKMLLDSVCVCIILSICPFTEVCNHLQNIHL